MSQNGCQAAAGLIWGLGLGISLLFGGSGFRVLFVGHDVSQSSTLVGSVGAQYVLGLLPVCCRANEIL